MQVTPSIGPPDVLLHLTGRLVEVSSHSLRMHRIVVRCDLVLPHGTEVRVVFLTPSGPLSIAGAVRWARDGEMGVYFMPLAPARAAELYRIVRSHGHDGRSGLIRTGEHARPGARLRARR